MEAAIANYRPAGIEYDLQLADALSNARRFADAVPVYQRAIQRDPDSAAALERMALCLSQMGNTAGAELALNRALAIAPNATRWVLLGEVRARIGKLREALEAFENAIKLDPQMPDAFATAGAIAFEMGAAAQAETALRRAILLHPNHPAAHNNLGNLLAESNRFEEAEFHFEAALHIQPNYAGARYDYALALIRVHRLDEARAQLETILKTADSQASGPDTAVRREARKLIEQLRKSP